MAGDVVKSSVHAVASFFGVYGALSRNGISASFNHDRHRHCWLGKINQAIPTFDRLIRHRYGRIVICICSACFASLVVGDPEFDLNARDFLLVYFFTIVGINSCEWIMGAERILFC